MPFFTYELTDPRNGPEPGPDEEVYVGVTDNIIRRFMQHIACRENDGQLDKKAWLLYLRSELLLPALKIRETNEERAVAEERETYWIRLHQARGARVLNLRKRDPDIDRAVAEDRASDNRGISGEELLKESMKDPFMRDLLQSIWSGEIPFESFGDSE